MADINKLAETLVNLKVVEVIDLANILKEKYGIDASAFQAVSSAPEAETIEKSKEKEKMSFDLILKGAGSAKLTVVKRIKDIIGLGLKESKELVDNAPKLLKKDLNKEEAESLKKQLEEVGAEVELK